MAERFTETLRAASEPGWSQAVELFAGTVPDAVMARYLIQDYRFLDSFLVLLGAALAGADTFEARLRFGRFIGMASSEENTYFLRAFEALGVTEAKRAADPDTQPTTGFKAIMREAAEMRAYAAALSVLTVTEWLYLDWASHAPQPRPQKLRARRMDRAARQRDPSRLCRVPARRAGPHRPGAAGSVPRLLPPRRRPRTRLFRRRLRRWGLSNTDRQNRRPRGSGDAGAGDCNLWIPAFEGVIQLHNFSNRRPRDSGGHG
jgi:thiaminase/transcriptional activator TenA